MRWLLLPLLSLSPLISYAQAGDPYERASNSFLELLGYTHDKYDWNKRVWWRPDSVGIQYENGRVVAVISFLYYPSWNGYVPQWRNYYRYKDDGKVESIIQSTWENQTWLVEDSMHYAYDGDGRLEQIYYATGPTRKEIHHYDENGNDTSAVTWRLDTKSQQWYPKYKTVREYSAQNMLLEKTQLMRDSTNWFSYGRNVFTYADTLLVDYKNYYKLNKSEPWILAERTLYTYDTLNRMDWAYTFTQDYVHQFGPDYKYHYTYSNDTLTSSSFYLYSNYFGKWEYRYTDTTVYVGDSLVLKERYFILPPSKNDEPSEIWKYKYLPEGDLKTQEYSFYNTLLNRYVPGYIFKFYYGDTVKTPEPPIEEPEPEPIPEVNIYPNPVIDHLNVHLPDGNDSGTLTLYSVKGQVAMNEELHTSKNVIPIQKMGLATGVYLYQLISGGQVYVGKLFVSGR